MTALVLLEFDAIGIKQPSRSAVAAATALGEVHALVGDWSSFTHLQVIRVLPTLSTRLSPFATPRVSSQPQVIHRLQQHWWSI